MIEKLKEINHIVVVMLENRSFDHMLGYLKLEKGRNDVDGLTGHEINIFNTNSFRPHKLSGYRFKGDPKHDWDDTAAQIKANNGGFVENFSQVDKENPGRIMGYHNAEDLPVFDHLAEEFCVCDRWFASIPGPTQPNRAYAVSGTSDGKKENIFDPKLFKAPQFFKAKTVFHHLDDFGIKWKYYSNDIAALRFNQHYFKATGPIDKFYKFIEATERDSSRDLPNVCWIDPDFGILPNFQPANDDHPPHDVRQGQRFVGQIYNLLLNAKTDIWKRTLLIVTYDEHGGFYDHVYPDKDKYKAADDDPRFQQYGVRVPAIIASPWVSKKDVAHTVFDHTSIIKTILLRFCQKPDGSIPDMGARVRNANDLSSLLKEPAPRTDCRASLFVPISDDGFRGATESGDEPESPSDLQKELLELRALCKAEGLEDSEL